MERRRHLLRNGFPALLAAVILICGTGMILSGFLHRAERTAEELLTADYYDFFGGTSTADQVSIVYHDRLFISIGIDSYPYRSPQNPDASVQNHVILGRYEAESEIGYTILSCKDDVNQNYLLLIPDRQFQGILGDVRRPFAYCLKAADCDTSFDLDAPACIRAAPGGAGSGSGAGTPGKSAVRAAVLRKGGT